MQQPGPFFFNGMSTKMAQSEERGPGHSEQGTWCTSWNGGQTEGTNHAHESWPWGLDYLYGTQPGSKFYPG